MRKVLLILCCVLLGNSLWGQEFHETIQPAYVITMSKKEQKKHYRLVYNFSRVYPYALMSKRIKDIADSTIAAQNMTKRQRKKYIAAMQAELMKEMDKTARNMTIWQGALLIKLIDRETGTVGYDIIKNYTNIFAAMFWQGVARLFTNNLKSKYDPEGADKDTEFLVQLWHRGEFDAYYFSIFWEYPKPIEIPSKYK